MGEELDELEKDENGSSDSFEIQEKDIGKLEVFVFNVAMVDAIRSAYKDPFEAIFEKGVHKGF